MDALKRHKRFDGVNIRLSISIIIELFSSLFVGLIILVTKSTFAMAAGPGEIPLNLVNRQDPEIELNYSIQASFNLTSVSREVGKYQDREGDIIVLCAVAI
jgi:hypothetical protein